MESTVYERLQLAAALARVKHAGQQRRGTGEPYFNHLRRVAIHVWDVGHRAQTIAYLHDLLEDTDLTAVDLRRVGFPWDVVDDVVALSRVEGEEYFDFIDRGIRDLTDDGLFVKLADVTDNLTDHWMGQRPSLRARYIKADLMIRAALHRRGLDHSAVTA
jgi:(p)ppGpp synthase/HD superfamily hydrolase